MPRHSDLDQRQPLFEAYIANARELGQQDAFAGAGLDADYLDSVMPASIGRGGRIVVPDTYNPRNGPALLVLTPDEAQTVNIDRLAKNIRLQLQASFNMKYYRPGNPESAQLSPYQSGIVMTRLMRETRERIDYTRVPLLQIGWYTPGDRTGMALDATRDKFRWDARVANLEAKRIVTQAADSRERVRIEHGAHRQSYEVMGRLGLLEGHPDVGNIERQLRKVQLLHFKRRKPLTPYGVGTKVADIVNERVHGKGRIASLRATIGIVALDKLLNEPETDEVTDVLLESIRHARFN